MAKLLCLKHLFGQIISQASLYKKMTCTKLYYLFDHINIEFGPIRHKSEIKHCFNYGSVWSFLVLKKIKVPFNRNINKESVPKMLLNRL